MQFKTIIVLHRYLNWVSALSVSKSWNPHNSNKLPSFRYHLV